MSEEENDIKYFTDLIEDNKIHNYEYRKYYTPIFDKRLGNMLNLIEKLQKRVDELDKENQRQAELLSNIHNKYQKEIEEKTTILMAGADKVKQLEKENQQLKDDQLWSEATIEGLKESFIPKEKVNCKIKEYELMLKTLNKKNDTDRIKAINERIIGYKELLGR